MPAESVYLQNKRRDWYDNSAFPGTSATLVYLSLHTTATDSGSGGTEVSGSNYSRTSIPASSIATDGNGRWKNSAAINTAVASGSWGTVTHVALYNASTAGDRLAYAPLSATRTVGSGQRLTFAIGAIVWDGSGS